MVLKINYDDETSFDVTSVDRVICIMGYTASATCLMSSLFDSHPNVLTTPDNHLGAFQNFWGKHGNLPLNLLLDAFLDKYIIIFDAKKRLNPKKGLFGQENYMATLHWDQIEMNTYMLIAQFLSNT